MYPYPLFFLLALVSTPFISTLYLFHLSSHPSFQRVPYPDMNTGNTVQCTSPLSCYVWHFTLQFRVFSLCPATPLREHRALQHSTVPYAALIIYITLLGVDDT
jgi:hypothetical protein